MEQTVTVFITHNPHNRGANLIIDCVSCDFTAGYTLATATLSRRDLATLERIAKNTGQSPCDIAAQLICAYPFKAN